MQLKLERVIIECKRFFHKEIRHFSLWNSGKFEPILLFQFQRKGSYQVL